MADTHGKARILATVVMMWASAACLADDLTGPVRVIDGEKLNARMHSREGRSLASRQVHHPKGLGMSPLVRPLRRQQKSGPARLEFATAGPAPCGVLRLDGTEVPRAIKFYVRISV
jgi:hypothetical protein